MIEDGPLWQIQQQIRSKKLLIHSAHDDIERITKRLQKTMEELREYEAAELILAKPAQE